MVPYRIYAWNILFLLCYLSQLSAKEKHIVIVVPSFNNAVYYEKNLESIITQEYTNYHVVYIDDCSPDGTGYLVEQFIKDYNLGDKIYLVKNTLRCLAGRNIYYAIHTFCKDDDIVAILDGDDWFAHTKVLARINEVYQDSEVWRTNGNFIQTANQEKGSMPNISKYIVEGNAFRKITWHNPPLRTYYAWLYKEIKLQDLLHQGAFFSVSQDAAKMYPIMEMAGPHFSYIPDILYIYNTGTPLNDFRHSSARQVSLVAEIQKRRPYVPLPNPTKPSGRIHKPFSCSLILLLKDYSQVSAMLDAIKRYYPFIKHVYFCSSFAQETVHTTKSDIPYSLIPYTLQNVTWIKNCVKIALKQGHEFCIVAQDDFFNVVQAEDITQSVLFIRRTKALGVFFAQAEKAIEPIRNTSLLDGTFYTFQLGWQPIFSTTLHQKAHMFTTHELHECLELFNDNLELKLQKNNMLTQKAGLLCVKK